eukprot:9430840-Pyramimonas_sp.AAC.1
MCHRRNCPATREEISGGFSTSLPPEKEDTLSGIAIVAEHWEPLDTYRGGDVNLQLNHPRDGDVEAAALLEDVLASSGSAAIHMPGPTIIDKESESHIDMFACPARQIYAYEP